MMRLCDGGLIWLQDDLGTVCVYVQGTQNQNQTGEGLQSNNTATNKSYLQGSEVSSHCIGGDALKPVIIEIEEDHLWLCCLENEVTEFLYLEAGLEGQLQLTSLDDNVGKIQQVDFKWIQHALSCDNDLFGLFLYRQRADESSHLFSCLPLGQLPQSFLPRPHTCVDDLEEELTSTRIEDKDGTIDGFGSQVTLKCLWSRWGGW